MHRPVIGTRGSPLALAQADLVRGELCRHRPELMPGEVHLAIIKTTGDRVQDRLLAEVGGKGLFTKEIDEALLSGSIDLAVHSMKDLPTHLPDGIEIAAVLVRADPRDVLITRSGGGLDAVPMGARVGTASLRRRAQLLAARPDLDVVPLRGNVGRRLAVIERGEMAATLLAAAGLARLGMGTAGGVPLAPEIMLPAVAQAAIAVTCRTGDETTASLLAPLDHAPSRICTTAERAMLAELEGSCRTPIGGFAELEGERLRLRGLVAAPDGSKVVRDEVTGVAADAEALGRGLGRALRTHMDPLWLQAP
jgi:hydroxymethylbilane synthase